jgi:hypothetical protein
MLNKLLKQLGLGGGPAVPSGDELKAVVENWSKQFQTRSFYTFKDVPTDHLADWDENCARPAEDRLQLIQILLGFYFSRNGTRIWNFGNVNGALAGKLLATLDITDPEVFAAAVQKAVALPDDYFYVYLHLAGILVKNAEKTWPDGVQDPALVHILGHLKKSAPPFSYRKDYYKLEVRIANLLPKGDTMGNINKIRPLLQLGNRPQIEQQIMSWLHQTSAPQETLLPWLESSLAAGDKPRPGEKWLKASQKTLASIPEAEQLQGFIALMAAMITEMKPLHQLETNELYRTDYTFPGWLACVPWYCAVYLGHHREIRAQMEQLANWCYKKLPGVGPAAPKIGNACLFGFSRLPGMEGIGALLRFKEKSTNRNVNKMAEALLEEAAARLSMQRGDMEDLSVPAFGLDERQQKILVLGDYSARLYIQAHREALLEWSDAKGKILKSVPAAVKNNYKEDLKALQLEFKELQQTLQTQFNRLENAYLELRQWTLNEFEQRFLQHPVLRSVAARLIWQMEAGPQQTSLIWHEEIWQNPAGEVPDWLDGNTVVRLWHPLNNPAEKVLAWRDWIENQNITQPFKQAYREVYLVTPPELRTETYSNRFAAQILRQHQFNALAKQRGWHYHLQGQWDSHNVPFRDLPNWNYRIEFWVDVVTDDTAVTDVGMYLYISTDQVRFYEAGQEVRVEQVPLLLFSELMRDVDLFVGVCSIGNDSNWQDQGNARLNTYWRNAAFSDELSESSKLRREVLERLIPRLKIASQCHFTDKYLVVKGKRHTYKIHCGSGNILRSPNDQYLCIVPDSSMKAAEAPAVYLPFEGDRMLSIIISKALLLAEDDKITDNTILRQL